MAQDRILVTGFEPYGGRGLNPAGEIARALNGLTVASATVVGRTLPVSSSGLGEHLRDLVAEVDPMVAVGVGLWPGEPVIRIERIALNLADFEIPDNEGVRLTDEPLEAAGPAARTATLPLRRIEEALLRAGIPARLSETAGTFLCNAALYALLDAAATRPRPTLCGFIHVPYTPLQVATLLRELRHGGKLERHQRADLASMELVTAIRALEIALGVAVEASHAT